MIDHQARLAKQAAAVKEEEEVAHVADPTPPWEWRKSKKIKSSN